ncbi:MAG TPA: succinate dehydrogenase [Pirellulales bacterium]|nr:succinate dehydrogenase [Pirellulales bacterium]
MEASLPAAPSVPATGFLGRHQFVIYRLFSMAGIFPIGAYFVVHLLTNLTVLDPQMFQESVDRIHSLRIFLWVVEWTFIFLPIAFHAVVGLIIISGGMPNTGSYPLSGNIRYTLQRATGMIALVFIVWHVIHLHYLFGGPFKSIGGAQFDDQHATSSAAGAIQAALWIQICYAIGVVACAYHFANGIWTAGITWGVWMSAAAQSRASKVCLAIGLALAAVGLGALFGMDRVDVPKVRAVEDRAIEAGEFEQGKITLPELKTQESAPPADLPSAESKK